MDREILLRPEADRDVDDLADYLGRDRREVGRRFYEAAWRVFRQLAAMPEVGRPQDFGRPELAGLRRIRVPGFEKSLIFYRPIDDGVEVLRVVHGARDLPALFEGEGP